MDKIVVIIVLLFTNTSLFSQDYDEEYFSSGEKAFYESPDTFIYKGYPLSYVNSFSYDFINIVEDTVSNNPLTGLLLDSSDWLKEKSYMEVDSINKESEFPFDTLNCRFLKFLKQRVETIGPVNTISIIHYDSLKDIKCILFTDSKYDYGTEGYWLAIQKNNIWTQYYLGLSENYFYHFKTVQKFPLFLNDTTIQVEAALVRQKTPEILPVGPPETFEVIKDNILIYIDLNKVVKDSDNDGLSDIEEKRLFLNPFSSDTDNDRILDKNDYNPRFRSQHSELSRLYNYIISNQDNLTDTCVDVSNKIKAIIGTHFNSEPFMIVCNDPNLQHLDFDKKVIIISKPESKHYNYPIKLNSLGITQLFKVDGKNNYYKFSVFASFYSSNFIAYKIGENRWCIRYISGIII